MLHSTLTILVLLGLASSTRADRIECGTKVRDVCPRQFKGDLNQEIDFLPDTAFLEKNCELMLSEITCVANFNETCALERQGMPEGFLRNFQKFGTEICDENSELGRVRINGFIGHDSCDNKARQICPQPRSNFAREVEFLPDANVLEKYCEPFIGNVLCMVEFNDTCPLEHVQEGIVFRDVLEFMQDFCDENTELGKGYRDNIGCVNSNKRTIYPPLYDLTLEISSFVAHQVAIGEPELGDKMAICLYLRNLPKKIAPALTDACGEEPLRVLELMKKPFMGSFCKPAAQVLAIDKAFQDFLMLQNGDRS